MCPQVPDPQLKDESPLPYGPPVTWCPGVHHTHLPDTKQQSAPSAAPTESSGLGGKKSWTTKLHPRKQNNSSFPSRGWVGKWDAVKLHTEREDSLTLVVSRVTPPPKEVLALLPELVNMLPCMAKGTLLLC